MRKNRQRGTVNYTLKSLLWSHEGIVDAMRRYLTENGVDESRIAIDRSKMLLEVDGTIPAIGFQWFRMEGPMIDFVPGIWLRSGIAFVNHGGPWTRADGTRYGPGQPSVFNLPAEGQARGMWYDQAWMGRDQNERTALRPVTNIIKAGVEEAWRLLEAGEIELWGRLTPDGRAKWIRFQQLPIEIARFDFVEGKIINSDGGWWNTVDVRLPKPATKTVITTMAQQNRLQEYFEQVVSDANGRKTISKDELSAKAVELGSNKSAADRVWDIVLKSQTPEIQHVWKQAGRMKRGS
jgi:hypothetical protein